MMSFLISLRRLYAPPHSVAGDVAFQNRSLVTLRLGLCLKLLCMNIILQPAALKHTQQLSETELIHLPWAIGT